MSKTDIMVDYKKALELRQQAMNSQSLVERAKLHKAASEQLLSVVEHMAVYSAALNSIASAVDGVKSHKDQKALSETIIELQSYFKPEQELAEFMGEKVRIHLGKVGIGGDNWMN